MSKRIKGICFDFDGVLLESSVDGFERVCEVFECFEIRKPTWKEYFRDYRKVILRYFKECERYDPTQQELHDWYKEFGSELQLTFFPEVSHVIQTLHAQKVPMWVISGNATEIVQTFLAKHNIFHLFDEVRGDEFVKSVVLRTFCNKHYLRPSSVAYVGDFPSDMQAAKDAGTYAIGRKTRKETDSILFESGADMCIETLHEILPLVPSKNDKQLQYKVIMKSYPKKGNGKTGKRFTVRKFDTEGRLIDEKEDEAPSFRKARKKLKCIIPGHLLATTEINNHGTTRIYR